MATRKDPDESTETVSDEGIDDDADDESDEGGGSRDYLVASVSKGDLELISR
jgi:hypothetical protein